MASPIPLVPPVTIATRAMPCSLNREDLSSIILLASLISRNRGRSLSALHAHGDAHAAADAQAWPGLFWHRASASRTASVVSTRAPDAPIGWPMAMAPPLTFTLAVSQPISLFTAQAWAAKASLASMRSRSETSQPAFLSAARLAGIGPEPISAGSTPAWAQEAMRASGVSPRALASSAVISTSAAAPSLMPEALAAVTVPSLAKAGLRPEMPS